MRRVLRLYLERMFSKYGPMVLSQLGQATQLGAQRPAIIRRPLSGTEQLGMLYLAQGIGKRYAKSAEAGIAGGEERAFYQQPYEYLNFFQKVLNPQGILSIPDINNMLMQAEQFNSQLYGGLGGLVGTAIHDYLNRGKT